MRGKYSPTVSAAYRADQEWFKKFCNVAPHGDQVYSPYDPEGFDSYGYDKNDVDRAGNHEFSYMNDDWSGEEIDSHGEYQYCGGNLAYDQAYEEWGFDGVKPVRK